MKGMVETSCFRFLPATPKKQDEARRGPTGHAVAATTTLTTTAAHMGGATKIGVPSYATP